MIRKTMSSAALLPALLFPVFAWAQPVVVVLDHGAEPREQLRYAFEVGPATQATMSMEMSMSMPGAPTPAMSMPAILVPISMQTTEVLADGSARYRFEMGQAAVAAGGDGNPLAQMLGNSLGQIGGMSGWGWLDARGHMLDGGLDQPAGVPGEVGQLMGNMQGSMQQLSAPFPAEAVGVGARWQVSTSAQLAGASVSQTTEYTLLARDGDEIELGLAMVQAAPTPPAGLPPEAQAALNGMRTEGNGVMTVDLSYAVPYSEMTMSTAMSIGMPGSSGGAQGMTMNMQMKMSVTPD